MEFQEPSETNTDQERNGSKVNDLMKRGDCSLKGEGRVRERTFCPKHAREPLMHLQYSHAGRQKEWLPPYFSQRRRIDISDIFGETHRFT
jgi:hypothetical protein